MSRSMPCVGLVLAGGAGRRLGGADKGLLSAGGETYVARLARALGYWTDELFISANRHASEYAGWADRVFADEKYRGEGPLAGLYTGLHKAASLGWQHVLVVPCDTPALSQAFFERLVSVATEHPDRVVVATLNDRLQPLHGMFPVSILSRLGEWLEKEHRDARGFVETLHPVRVDCDDLANDFLNVNRTFDQSRLATVLARRETVST